MTRELFNKLVEMKLITDTQMSFDYINKYNLTLKDIITIPAILEMLTEKPVEETTVEETVETVIEETVVEETVVEETVVEETVETVVDETVVEEAKEEIVVDETKVVTPAKTKSKKN